MSKKIICFLIGCVGILLLWEGAVHLYPHLFFVLPAPSRILHALVELRSRFLLHTFVTFKEMCCGFLLALASAFPLAWMMMRFHFSRALLQPFFIVIQCFPMFALAPIMVVWFGWGFTAIVIPTALMIFFPLTLNIYQGLKSTPVDLLEFFQSNQATPWQTLWKLRLPWALPHIFSGLRISAAIAGVGAVAGEWAGAQNGLGILMLESRRNVDLEITFGALICLTLMTGGLYITILFSERLLLLPRRWRWSLFKNPLSERSFRKKGLVFPFLLPLLCWCCWGCSSPPPQQTRLLLDWLPNPNHVPLYVGLEEGFFQDEGINLVIQKMHEGGGGISYLVAGQADLLINHMPGTFKAAAHGAELQIVGVLIKEPLSGLIYRQGIDIQEEEHDSSWTLGYCLGLPDTTFLDFLLAQGNIHPTEKKNVSVDLIAAMGTRSVDCIYGGFWNIEPFQLEFLGIKTKVIKIQDLGVPPYYEMIIVAKANTPYTSSSFVASFQKALQKSIDYCHAHPEKAFAHYVAYNPDRRQKTVEWQWKAWEATLPLLVHDQSLDPSLFEAFYTWQRTHDIVKQSFDFHRLIPTLSPPI